MNANFKKYAGHSMIGFTLLLAAVIMGSALMLLVAPGALRQADAAVTNYPPGVGVHAMPMHLAGPYTAASTTAVTFKLPFAGRLIGFGAAATTLSGTVAVDFQAGGVSLLSAPITLSTAYGEATITTSAVADEATLTVVVTGNGTQSGSNITVLPTFLRR